MFQLFPCTELYHSIQMNEMPLFRNIFTLTFRNDDKWDKSLKSYRDTRNKKPAKVKKAFLKVFVS